MWFKNGKSFVVDGHRVIWQRAGQSGSITFLHPQVDDQGYYQCSVSNIYGVAMSHIFKVKTGVLNYFDRRPVKDVIVEEGQPLTLECNKPYGVPSPTIFWLYRDLKKSYAMDTIHREHITSKKMQNTEL
ncbi:neuroglian [Trichinella spiralis]|uniref:neuroglian n=1 Tax=Trichinella spiralis TaxID=6334 RepID=UPI0001EFE5DE|nr:neuroglian [Trichinella spiralis]